MERFSMPELAGKKVHVDFTNLKCTDAEYVRVALRARIAQQGAVLVEAAHAGRALDLEFVRGARAEMVTCGP